MIDALRANADPSVQHPAMLDPWHAAATWGDGVVLAVLTDTHGPSYRDPGAAIAIAPDGRFAGAITAGCVEADLKLRAADVRRTGEPLTLRYGEGSRFFDLRLPCGGAVEILLFLVRDTDALGGLSRAREARRPASVLISPEGAIRMEGWRPTGLVRGGFQMGFRPPLRFLIFGTGAEASAFGGLIRGMDYDHILLSHEDSSLAAARASGSPTRLLLPGFHLADLEVDADTAVVLFYHDHDYEPEILKHFAETPAFYIGAQGSRATQANRLARLAEMRLPQSERDRIRGPIGLIPSSRDPRALAISVLAEVVEVHGKFSTCREGS